MAIYTMGHQRLWFNGHTYAKLDQQENKAVYLIGPKEPFNVKAYHARALVTVTEPVLEIAEPHSRWPGSPASVIYTLAVSINKNKTITLTNCLMTREMHGKRAIDLP